MLKNLMMHLLRAPARALRARRDRMVSSALIPAMAQFNEKKYGDAARACKAVIAQSPRSAQAHHLCGRALSALGRHAEAMQYLHAAVAADPDLAAAHADLADVLFRSGELGEAEVSSRRAVVLRPDELEYRLRLVEILENSGQEAEALAELSIAQEFAPGRFDLLVRLFRTLSRLGMYPQALRIAERAVIENGENDQTLYLLAAARYGVADMQGAVEACRKIPGHRDDRPEVYVTLGSALFALGRVDDARAAYQRALDMAPDSADALFHIGLIQLMSGEYGEGWRGFEQRFRREKNRTMRPCSPPWDGISLQGRSALVMREQGLGDEIMFASCYPQLISQARRCFIECDPRLAKLFSRSFPDALIYALDDIKTGAQTDPGGEVDVRIYAGSLPRHFRKSLEDFPVHDGYLKPDPLRTAYWRERLESLGRGLKVGVSWRGGTVFTHQERRTLSLAALLPVLSVPGVRWINLQYGKRDREIAGLRHASGIEIVDWPEAIDGDYDETAALVSALDLVISVCTSVVHLTGALGRPAWVMTALVPEWRYGLRGPTMPWYPQVRLFRQDRQGDWDPVISAIRRELAQRAADHR
ncbi:MAG: tetratricopeptide repeat protein [Burkholderiales bacterium]|nr:tetratricopeptide repeat protein [Burkholderiales bacterium]